MAAPTATAGGNIEASAFDWATAGCALCHVGGGGLEYSRAAGSDQSLYPFGIQAISGDNSMVTTKGSTYWYFPQFGIAPGGAQYAAGPPTPGGLHSINWSNVSNESNKANSMMVEVDCLMCHYQSDNTSTGWTNRYNIHQRGVAVRKLKGSWSASAALPGATLQVDSNSMPRPITGIINIPSLLTGDKIGKSKRENCANCHAGDGSLSATAADGTPLGRLNFFGTQIAGAVYDADDKNDSGTTATCNPIVTSGSSSTAAGDCANNANWPIRGPRASDGKRAFTINNNAPNSWTGGDIDVHLDLAPRGDMRCSDCHYLLEGNFKRSDIAGGIYANWPTTKRIDHIFAKGHSFPDGKNSDHFDNTVSCEMCHIDQDHPNLKDGTGVNAGKKVIINQSGIEKVVKKATHPGFPTIHFNKIACRTCHIPYTKPTKFIGRDFTAGPYMLGNRELRQNGTIRPAYFWYPTSVEPSAPQVKIVPAHLTTQPIWANYADRANDKVVPIYTRRAFTSAERIRDGLDAGASSRTPRINTFGWLFNNAANNNFLMINTVAEIDAMTKDLGNWSNAANPIVPDPVMNLFSNPMSTSHTVKPKSEALTCINCHSSSDPASPNYSPQSIGFFDRNITLFYADVNGNCSSTQVPNGVCGSTTNTKNTGDYSGNNELKQTVNIAGSDTVNEKTRVRAKLDMYKSDGTAFKIDLAAGKNHGDPIRNYVNQNELLGYSAERLATLTQTIGTTKPQARLRVTRVKDNPATTNVDESARGLKVAFTDISLCPSGTCTKTTKVGEMVTTTVCNATTTVTTSEHTFTLDPGVWKGNFCAELSVTDNATGLNSTRTFPITLTKRNTRPTLTNVVVTSTVDRIPTITFTASDDDDASSALQVQVVWGDGTTKTVAGNTGTVTKDTAYANRTKTYNVRLTVIDTKGGRTRVTQAVAITATTP